MCILCKNKKTEIPNVNLKASIQSDVNKSGLSNTINIYNEVSFCNEDFKSPLYYVDGAVKATTGYTTTACSGVTSATTYSISGCSAVFNVSEITDFDLTFVITGNTQYSGYTGDFCHHIFDLSKIQQNTYVTKQNSVLSNCYQFSGITGSSVVTNILSSDLGVKDAQYFIKDYNNFYTKNCLTKLLINTFDVTSQTTSDLYSDGWYFITVTNPEKPSLVKMIRTDLINSSVLVNEVISIVDGQSSIFKVNGTPLNNKMIVYVNGIQLTEGYDWTPVIGSVGFIQLLTGTIESRDRLTVTYLSLLNSAEDIFNLNETQLSTDAFIVDTIYTGATSASTVPILNYNPTENKQEILLTNSVSQLPSIIFVVNGVTLTENVDYYKSSTNNRKIILDPKVVLKIGDYVSAFYMIDDSLSFLDLGYFRTLEPNLDWSVPTSYANYSSNNGKFLLQVTTSDDVNFDTPIQQKYVDFIQTKTNYTQKLDLLPTNLGNKFLFRIYFFKHYNILFDNVITTRSVSDVGTFTVNINYSNNSY